ncbi:MAG: DUF342 domain-containing protein [Clostridiaceae bacterium]|jgi:uncharacterized protein (DUF342 family)|nr:DUF342 domain-containing protein [Clostridiaceae bacterium]
MSDNGIQQTKGYEITYKEDGVYLTVYPPVGFINKVNQNDVLNHIAKKGIERYNANLIVEAVKRRDGKAVKIAEPQPEKKVDSTVEAYASDDKMQAFITATQPEGGGAAPTFEMIIRALHDKGIVACINEGRIREFENNPIYGVPVLVAEGIPAENGKNGSLRYLVDIHKDRKPIIMEDGTVNYKDINLIANITKDQKLVEVIPPVPGKNGMNVVGTELKALDGKPAVIPRGRGVYMNPEGTELYAEIDGQLKIVDGKINVYSVYEVPADVDNSTGNIRFIGNVTVRGNVLSGFEIEAGGDIEVSGVVEAARLRAAGNIILRRGMVGGGKGELIAGGDIIAKFIENSKVEVEGDLKAEALMHCNIKCGSSIILGGRKGLLVGGIARVGKFVEAKYLGNQMFTQTIVEVGFDPHMRERLKFLKAEIVKMEDGHNKANQAIALLNRLKNATGELTLEKRELLAKSTRTKFFYENKLAEYKKEMATIEERLQHGVSGRIKVMGSVYPGVRVVIGNAMLYIKEENKYCTMYSDGADIRFGPL